MWENCIESVSKVKSGVNGLGCILAHSMGLGKTLQACVLHSSPSTFFVVKKFLPIQEIISI